MYLPICICTCMDGFNIAGCTYILVLMIELMTKSILDLQHGFAHRNNRRIILFLIYWSFQKSRNMCRTETWKVYNLYRTLLMIVFFLVSGPFKVCRNKFILAHIFYVYTHMFYIYLCVQFVYTDFQCSWHALLKPITSCRSAAPLSLDFPAHRQDGPWRADLGRLDPRRCLRSSPVPRLADWMSHHLGVS